MSLTIDTITEKLLHDDVVLEVKQLMAKRPPEDLAALDLLAILAILRAAAERLDRPQRSEAPVLALVPARKARARQPQPQNQGA
jgi:hypothetical protein